MSVPYAVDGTKATLQFTVIYVSVKVHAYSHTSRGVFSRRVGCRARLRTLYNRSPGLITLISRGLSRSSDSTPTGAAPRARARARRVAVGRGACAARGLVHIEHIKCTQHEGERDEARGFKRLCHQRPAGKLDVAYFISLRTWTTPSRRAKVHSLLLCVQARTVIVVFDRSPCAASTTIPI